MNQKFDDLVLYCTEINDNQLPANILNNSFVIFQFSHLSLDGRGKAFIKPIPGSCAYFEYKKQVKEWNASYITGETFEKRWCINVKQMDGAEFARVRSIFESYSLLRIV